MAFTLVGPRNIAAQGEEPLYVVFNGETPVGIYDLLDDNSDQVVLTEANLVEALFDGADSSVALSIMYEGIAVPASAAGPALLTVNIDGTEETVEFTFEPLAVEEPEAPADDEPEAPADDEPEEEPELYAIHSTVQESDVAQLAQVEDQDVVAGIRYALRTENDVAVFAADGVTKLATVERFVQGGQFFMRVILEDGVELPENLAAITKLDGRLVTGVVK